MAEIRPNRAKRKLAAGEPVLAPNLGSNSVPDLDTLEQLASQGLFDVAWVEMEHGPWSWRELGDVSRVCDLWGITSVVRVSQNEPGVITRALDRGVQGVLVPHVNTKEEAERAVQGALYTPRGARGMGLGRQGFAVPDYFRNANREVFIMVLLEEIDCLRNNLREILTVPNIDVFFVGPGDLSLSMGPEYAGQLNHPEVQRAVREAIEIIVGSGRHAGTLVNDGNVKDFLQLGVRFLRYSASAYLQEGMRNFQRSVGAVELSAGSGSRPDSVGVRG